MEIKEITDKKTWEGFLEKCKEKTFLQSFNWGEFNKMMGNKIWRLGIYQIPNSKFQIPNLLGVVLVIKISAKRGTFLFVPHGPIIIQNAKIKNQNENLKFKILKKFLEELKKLAKEEKCDFIRIAPILEKNEENERIFKELGFREAPIHIHPEITWELDISKSEDEILKGMRKTTRYLIKQALKNKEIEILKSEKIEDLKEFNKIYQETAKRHCFVPFSFDYLRNEFLAFKDDKQILIILGKYRDEVVSGGVFVFWQNICFYHHGASSQKYPKIPVSYLMIWEAIKEAKNRGCQKFNFWGIAPLKNSKSQIPNSKHPWAGLTLFKMGFGGEKKEYVKTQDLPISKKYWICYLIEKIRKKKRGV
jgi:lipid II:glycine glycyltransferase (peptidoglycan interpeptide bridge formation enzyme)